ncbi:MAG: hypothetical protein JWP12_2457 [Bacteroidetes bacterium]|nr:hypothetical protein [Bacteroidota bacterium]
MKQQKFNDKRLLHYANYLEANNLKCTKFYSSISNNKAIKDWAEKSDKPLLLYPILELPLIFTDDWFYDKDYMPVYYDSEKKDTVSSIISFFGINQLILFHLFSPGAQIEHAYGGQTLYPKSSHKTIAYNIYELVDVVRHYEGIKDNETQILNN